MMLYTVYKNDYECPEELFNTCDKSKAEKFIQQFNSINYDEDSEDKEQVFLRELNIDDIEIQADTIINKYQKKLITTIYYNKMGLDYTIVSSKFKFIDINEIKDSAEICDYMADFNQWNIAYIYLVTDTLPDLNDENVKEYINQLLDEEYKFQYSLYND